MTTQNNIAQYATAIQAQLKTVVGSVPVYSLFNRNFATEPLFVTWQLRDVHQDVYTGIYQSNKGIDRPTFQISVFSGSSQSGFELANTIIQALHGYTGQFGGVGGFYIAKADVTMLYHGYDDEIKLYNIFMDCTIDIPA
jgi:hypothetical protein